MAELTKETKWKFVWILSRAERDTNNAYVQGMFLKLAKKICPCNDFINAFWWAPFNPVLMDERFFNSFSIGTTCNKKINTIQYIKREKQTSGPIGLCANGTLKKFGKTIETLFN